MIAAGIKVTGLRGLNDQLADLGSELGIKALAQAARVAFEPVLAAARAKVPVRTGAMRAALRISVAKPGGGGDTVVKVGIKIIAPKDSRGGVLLGRDEPNPARRWHWIELGTAHTAAHPFLRPALDENTTAVIDRLKIEIQKSIDKAIKKRSST